MVRWRIVYKIKRPSIEDKEELFHFFKFVITDTFNKEGIGDKLEDLELEIETKQCFLEDDLESNGQKRHFLIALADNKIVGTIEYGPVSELICKGTENAYQELVEVGTVLIHPDYQGRGIGNLLLNAICQSLEDVGIEEFCLDCGYILAQKVWLHKFGTPNYHLKDYWDLGYDHMIWRVKVEDILKDIKT